MRKRKHFRNTYTSVHFLLADPVRPMPIEFRDHQLTRMWGGLAAIETAPHPTRDDWAVCSDAVNLMETLVKEMRLCVDERGLLPDAIKALAMAGQRNLSGGNIRMDAAGIFAVRSILEDYASMLDALPHRTMIKCHMLTEKRIQTILKGHKLPHDVEVIAL